MTRHWRITRSRTVRVTRALRLRAFTLCCAGIDLCHSLCAAARWVGMEPTWRVMWAWMGEWNRAAARWYPPPLGAA